MTYQAMRECFQKAIPGVGLDPSLQSLFPCIFSIPFASKNCIRDPISVNVYELEGFSPSPTEKETHSIPVSTDVQ